MFASFCDILPLFKKLSIVLFAVSNLFTSAVSIISNILLPLSDNLFKSYPDWFPDVSPKLIFVVLDLPLDFLLLPDDLLLPPLLEVLGG